VCVAGPAAGCFRVRQRRGGPAFALTNDSALAWKWDSNVWLWRPRKPAGRSRRGFAGRNWKRGFR
jgi:hypothetical protein